VTATDVPSVTAPQAVRQPVAPADSHCHVTRPAGDDPCVLGTHDGDVHEDPDGTEYLTVALPPRKEARNA
jgi:hypothetical protein